MKLNYFSISSLAFLLFLLLSIGVALSATNSVSTSGLSDQTINITANDLKPAECASLSLNNVVLVIAGVPLVTTGNSGDLILGTNTSDDITARKGDDCIVGGAGDDIIDGNQGNDIILGGAGNDQINGNNSDDTIYGGPGNDTLDGGAGNDVCIAGGGSDTFNRCETIQ